jgi:hypothetical protein
VRLLLIVPLLAALLAVAACGDDDNTTDGGPAASANPSDPPPATVSTRNPGIEQPSANAGLPSPTVLKDDDIALIVGSRGTAYQPTIGELKALPQATIQAGGTKTGVLLSVLAAKVSGQPTDFVTITGRLQNLAQAGAIRFLLSEIGDTTVIYVDGEGRVTLASTTIPQEQWLTAITDISIAPPVR